MENQELGNTLKERGEKAEKIFRKADEYETPRYLSETLEPLTGDADPSRVSAMILAAIRWVAAMDYYHETGDADYDAIAKEQRQVLDNFLTEPQKTDFKSMEEKIVDPYWSYEANMKKQITDGYTFSNQEVEESIMRRSSDSLLYGALTGYEYPLPQEIVEVLHVRQALEDIEDCVEDYDEDLKELEPNIFFLYFLSNKIPRDLWPKDFTSARELIDKSGILSLITSFIKRSYEKAKEVPSLKKYPDLEKNLDAQYESIIDTLGSQP